MSTARALAWNTAAQAIGKVISTAIGVVVIGLMTRYLGQQGFGLYTTANAYFQIFAIILDFGLNVTLVQMLGEHAGDTDYENRITSSVFTLRTVSAFVLLTIAAFIGLGLDYPWPLKMALFAIWGSFFFTALNQIVIGVQQRHLKTHIVAIGEVVGRIILLSGVLLCINQGWGLVPIVLVVSLGGIANFAVNTAAAMRYASFRWNWDTKLWKTILTRSWPIGVSIIFNLLYYKADTLILGHFRSFEEVGVYGAAYRVLEILITLPFMYCGVLLPIIAQAWTKKQTARFQNLLQHSYIAMMLLAAPMVAGSIALGSRIMAFVAGAEFASSGKVLEILAFAVGLIFLGTVSSHAIVALDKQRAMLRYYVIIAITTCAGYILFIPTYGMYAAAWLTVGSEAAVALATTWITLKTSRTKVSPIPHLKILMSAVIMYLAVLPFVSYSLPIPIFIGAIVYTIAVLASGVISRDTIKEILNVRQGTPPADAT